MTMIQTSTTGREMCDECGTAPIDTYRGMLVDGLPYCEKCREESYLGNEHGDGLHEAEPVADCGQCESDAQQAEIDAHLLAQYNTEDLRMKSTHWQLVDRSYNFANITEKMPVVFLEDAYYGGAIPAGTKGTLMKTFNAGFNGIEARVQLADRRVTVSAGYVKFDNSI